ncbi:hypothetical protein [Afipia sp. DC4300-2b1]
MTDAAANNVVTALVTEIRGKLEETLSIAKAAESCARWQRGSRGTDPDGL